ncbi:MAG: TIR domain-containing protein [Myxococcales bacterium]|nr:TIR domain-containing protein [Myxococcales bacterium]
MSSGRIITFYSYKGGVGRTMALANIASVLARWDYRVLCIDWDLEAPGLDLYLKGQDARQKNPGLVDFITACAQDESPDWRQFVSQAEEPRVDFIHAGRSDGHFLRRMQNIDWDALYRDKSFGNYIEDTLRAEWCAEYDFVLVDSRTGVTDTSGICTAQLPDIIVALFTANHQSFDGVLRVLSMADKRRDELPFDRPRALVLPVISRFEIRVEYEQAQKWLGRFHQDLAEHLRWWVASGSMADMLAMLRVPYVPYWSFGERVAVNERGVDDPDDVGHAYETLAALLVHGLLDSDKLIKSREEYVKLVSRERPQVAITEDDVLVIASRSDVALASAIQSQLQNEGFRVALAEDSPGDRDEMLAKLRASRNYVFIVGPDWRPWRAHTVEAALAIQQASEQPRRLVPLLREGMSSLEIPGSLRHLVAVRQSLPSITVTEIIRALGLSRRTIEVERQPEEMGLLELLDAIDDVAREMVAVLHGLDTFVATAQTRYQEESVELGALWNRADGHETTRAPLIARGDEVAKQLTNDAIEIEHRLGTLKTLDEWLARLVANLRASEVAQGYHGEPRSLAALIVAADEGRQPDALTSLRAIPAVTGPLRGSKRELSHALQRVRQARRRIAGFVRESVADIEEARR